VANVVLSMAYLSPASPFRSKEPNMGPVEESLFMKNLTAVSDGDLLNISLRILNTGGTSICLGHFEINHQPQSSIRDLQLFLNDTETDSNVSADYNLGADEEVKVCMIMPRSDFNQELITVQVNTPNAYYYQETAMPRAYISAG